jgi:hypothetical protein
VQINIGKFDYDAEVESLRKHVGKIKEVRQTRWQRPVAMNYKTGWLECLMVLQNMSRQQLQVAAGLQHPEGLCITHNQVEMIPMQMTKLIDEERKAQGDIINSLVGGAEMVRDK